MSARGQEAERCFRRSAQLSSCITLPCRFLVSPESSASVESSDKPRSLRWRCRPRGRQQQFSSSKTDMSLLELAIGWASEPISWIALVLGVLTVCLLQFLRQVHQLPRGPLPLPIIGNILQLRQPRPLYEKAVDWSREYGDPFTIWIGMQPFVVASSKESFKDISGPLRNVVAGRAPTNMGKAESRGYHDVVYSDFSPAWDVLRKLAHVAMRKYAQTKKLSQLIVDRVDSELEDVLCGKREATHEVINYLEGVINNVLAVSTFGEGFKRGDEVYEEMQTRSREIEKIAPNGLPSDILPILGYIFFKQENAARAAIAAMLRVTDTMFDKSKASWTPGQTRHFTDVLLNARVEFLAEDRASSKYLTDNSLRQVVFDIFGAGIVTSKSVLGYCLIHLANEPDLQEELRREITSELGFRACTLEDRARLCKCDSFLQEVIRFYPPAPLSLPRRALADATINGRFIPEGAHLFINLYAVNRDTSIWGEDANEFRADRFLTATKDQLARGANSFGIGARSCPGEKLGQADIFYIMVRTIQRVHLSYRDGPGSANLQGRNSDILLDPCRQDVIFNKLD